MPWNVSQIWRTALRAAIAGAIAYSAAAPAVADVAYVGNQGGGTISLIDTATDEVIRTLPDQGKIGEKVQAVITNRAQTRSFVVDAAGDTLVVIDLASGRIQARLAVGKAPEGASLSPSGKTLAVCVEDDNVVALVDVATAKIIKKIHTQGTNPEHCAFSGDERWLMTSNENSDNVDIIDLHAGRSIALVSSTGHPRGIAWLPNRPIAYVAQEGGGGVDIVNVEQRSVVQFIKTGLRPAGVIASADGSRVFVSNGGDATVSAIDPTTQKVIASIPVGKRPWNMALTHDGKKLYVANGRSHSVSVIDTASLAGIKEIVVGELPWGVSIP
jgi:YVTN family beta-propeller protein